MTLQKIMKINRSLNIPIPTVNKTLSPDWIHAHALLQHTPTGAYGFLSTDTQTLYIPLLSARGRSYACILIPANDVSCVDY